MDRTVRIQGVDVEIESRYRVEIGEWQATLRHPVHGFTVSEWGTTPADALEGARRALIFYGKEMERFTGNPGGERKWSSS